MEWADEEDWQSIGILGLLRDTMGDLTNVRRTQGKVHSDGTHVPAKNRTTL